MAINDPIPPSFPGLMEPCYSGASGSDPSPTPEPDDVPIVITATSGAWYPGARHETSTHGTIVPGQNDDGFSGQDTSDMTDSGVGPKGQTDPWGRFDWQQKRGGA